MADPTQEENDRPISRAPEGDLSYREHDRDQRRADCRTSRPGLGFQRRRLLRKERWGIWIIFVTANPNERSPKLILVLNAIAFGAGIVGLDISVSLSVRLRDEPAQFPAAMFSCLGAGAIRIAIRIPEMDSPTPAANQCSASFWVQGRSQACRRLKRHSSRSG